MELTPQALDQIEILVNSTSDAANAGWTPEAITALVVAVAIAITGWLRARYERQTRNLTLRSIDRASGPLDGKRLGDRSVRDSVIEQGGDRVKNALNDAGF